MLIDALGGTNAVAALFGVGASAVSQWRRDRGFPGWTHMRLAEICRERGIAFEPAILRGLPRGKRQAGAAA